MVELAVVPVVILFAVLILRVFPFRESVTPEMEKLKLERTLLVSVTVFSYFWVEGL